MSGDHADPPEAAKLTGLAKHFNSITLRGRANVAMATYAVGALIGIYLYVKPSKKK
ncbi:unnamed protein product [Ceutorhynchus assimilis]|uniref:Up-regulated during skeletal muscle growth protein 5 n=1 Tax=Ceutorhynchus assimilis TaxID=467358 RepID=A0A9N9N0D3_9CUCU|nr:unnamed protein product [Ceutorhynchus assimilis]